MSRIDFPVLPESWARALTKTPVRISNGSGPLPSPNQIARNGAGNNGSTNGSTATNGSGPGTPYGIRSQKTELRRLKDAWRLDDGTFNIQLNRTAFALAQLAAGGELDAATAYQDIEQVMAELGAPADQYKSLRSGWSSGLNEPRNATTRRKVRTPTGKPGDLRSADTYLEYGKLEKSEEGDSEIIWRPWSNFDIRMIGKTRNERGEIGEYEVDVIRDLDGATVRATLPVRILAKPLELAAWLNKYEATVLVSKLGQMSWNARLQQYLASQDAEIWRIASHLGWDDESESFLTFEGVLTPNGMLPFDGVRPDPALRDQAIDYQYGFVGRESDAVAVLREVLTFQTETVTSVFGSWWAACWLKGQIMRKVTMFPAMAIEAPSGSGKTNGFFKLMGQLSGDRRGEANDTMANFRDIVAGHRSGIARQDDLDNPKKLFEVLRAATGESTMGKKGEDRHSSVDAKLVAPIVLSGEGLQIGGQKALVDRLVTLEVSDPSTRMSLHDPTRIQYEDLLVLRDKYPQGLHAVAGHLGAIALRHANLVEQIRELRGTGGGRHAEKMSIIRLGARILAAMTGDQRHVKVVDDWVAGQVDFGNQNTLTGALVPECLKLIGACDTPRRYDHAPHHSVPHPVLVRADNSGNPALWVNIDFLAQWWKEHHRGPVDARTETAAVLRQQALALGMKGERIGVHGVDYVRLRVHSGDSQIANRNERHAWQRVPDSVSESLLEVFNAREADTSNVTDLEPGGSLAERVAMARHRLGR